MNIFSKIKNYLFLDVDVKMNWFSRLVAGLKLREAINKADDAFRENGNRYYVLPSWRGKDLIVMDRKSFRQLKHKRYIHTRHSLEMWKGSASTAPRTKMEMVRCRILTSAKR